VADPRGFLTTRERETQRRRPVPVRIMDFKDVYEKPDPRVLHRQAGRCMDCGVPFCHAGCPLGNLIPEWNDLVWRGRMDEAVERLHATNNFPELTGRLCPAPCESSCVLGINQPAVTIKQMEVAIADAAFEGAGEGLTPQPPARHTDSTVAVVGSGPAGLAAAQQLTRAGHTVAVYERDDVIGGLLRLGIPDYKLEKQILDARLEQMRQEGTRFRTNVEVGRDVSWSQLKRRYDAVVVATGATVPRDLPIPGRSLDGVHFAMDYLVRSNRGVAGTEVKDPIDAKGKHVVVLGGGDTGADCIGTAHRQGAASVTTLAIGKQPPHERPVNQPWPVHPNRVFEVATRPRGGRRAAVSSPRPCAVVDAEDRVSRALKRRTRPSTRTPVSVPTGGDGAGSSRRTSSSSRSASPARRTPELDTELGARLSTAAAAWQRIGRLLHGRCRACSSPATPDVGQSLIVWAIAEGRAAAASVGALPARHQRPSRSRASHGPGVQPGGLKPRSRGRGCPHVSELFRKGVG
jgi:glutamate synthase (NADPH/NADH) small chain